MDHYGSQVHQKEKPSVLAFMGSLCKCNNAAQHRSTHAEMEFPILGEASDAIVYLGLKSIIDIAKTDNQVILLSNMVAEIVAPPEGYQEFFGDIRGNLLNQKPISIEILPAGKNQQIRFFKFQNIEDFIERPLNTRLVLMFCLHKWSTAKLVQEQAKLVYDFESFYGLPNRWAETAPIADYVLPRIPSSLAVSVAEKFNAWVNS